jgi:hypothetical protein
LKIYHSGVQCFNSSGTMITNGARYTRGIQSRIAMADGEGFFHLHIGRQFKEATSKVLHLELGFIWC